MTQLFTDHSNLDDMVEVARLNAFRSTGTRFGYVQSFWSSIARPASSPIAEVLEIAFTDRYLINSVRFDLAKYPQIVRLQYFDDVTGSWIDMTEASGRTAVRHIHECVPRQIPPPSSVTGHQHPQHAFIGHWHKERLQLKSIETLRIRLVLTRQQAINVPTDMYGNEVDYSLAVRGFVIGYQVASRDDVPRMLPVDSADESYFNSFAETDDVVSSNVSFSLRELGAERAIRDNAPDLAWRCEPQPDPNCVVSIYADVRTAKGKPQVIDRIFLDPINSGGHITAYFAQNAPSARFLSQDKPISSSSIRVDASSGIIVTDSGMTFPAGGSLILDNRDFSYEAAIPWWIGMTLVPTFAMGTGTHTVIDTGIWNFAFTSTGIVFTTNTGDSIPLVFDYQSASPVTVVIGYDGNTFTLWATGQLGQAAGEAVASAPLEGIEKIAIGSLLDRSSVGDCKITNLVIKNESPIDPEDYQADPRSFSRVETHTKDEPDTSKFNAVLRFDPQTDLQSEAYPWCVFGGTPSRFEAMEWTPVAREYINQRGWMELPPIRASYWKLEFTGLPPVYADVFLPIARQVKRFPASVLAAYRARQDAASEPAVLLADSAHMMVAGHTNYIDTPVVVSTGGTGKGFTNTEVYIAEDSSTTERLYKQFGSDWSYQEWMAPYASPRFESRQVHLYDVELVSRTSKIAYQVGLRSLKFARTDKSAQYDMPQYEEMFYDTAGLDLSTNWVFDDEKLALTSGRSNSAILLSQTLHSNRRVRGVQFAAQQSPPQQILPDAEFEDPTAGSWSTVGDARLGELVSSVPFGQLLPVKRTLLTGYWEDIAPRYGTWGGIEAAGATWGDLEAATGAPASSPSGNGVLSEAVDLPAGGYLYAATRVIADKDLFAPLWLQIVDDSGTVLAESEATVRKGQVTEWYTLYELGGQIRHDSITWGELAGEVHLPSYLDNFTRANSTTLDRMLSGQLWSAGELWHGTAGSSLAIASNRAAVTGTGQRSVIDVGTPWGALTVQLGHIITGAYEMLDLGGIIVLANGEVRDSESGHLFTTLTLADNDTLLFEFMPTAQVPSGHTSGADASILSWSISITRNGSFVSTISTARAFKNTRGLSGNTGQTFQSFSWVPSIIASPIGTIIQQDPVPRDGAFNSTSDTWIETGGRRWFLTGTFNQVDLGILQELAAPTGVSFEFDTDVGGLYGALTTKIGLSGTTLATDYYVLKLDDGSTQLLLRANGDLVQFTSSLGYVTLAAGVCPSFSDTTTVLFAETAKLSTAFKTAHSLSSSYNQTLVFLNGNTVVGTYQANNLWTSTMRGVMGTDGSTITGFTWAPNLGQNATGSGVRTWDDISGGGTRTWGDIARSSTQLSGSVHARVVQKEATNDAWMMDSLAIFADPIVWEFSNDGGANWTAASPIRNNPRGVVMFDQGQVADRLRYRVTSYGQFAWISHLVIRPWYIGHMRDVPRRPETPHGPNLQALDSYMPVEEDPNFMVWNLPIPREWWFAFRSLLPGITPAKIQYPVTTERELL